MRARDASSCPRASEPLLTLLLVLLPWTAAPAETITVPDGDPTIQAGIVAAASGDTVLVQPGTYAEYINFQGKAITVASLFLTTGNTSYISQTVINGSNSGHVARFSSGEDPLFSEPGNGDLHLAEDSPCIDAGNPASPSNPDGSVTDMGALW